METAVRPSGATSLDHANFVHCAEVIKQMAGLPHKKPLPIRESIRRGIYRETVGLEINCEILNNWSLVDRLEFLKSMENMTGAEKIVRIYEKVYDLWKTSVNLSALQPQSAP